MNTNLISSSPQTEGTSTQSVASKSASNKAKPAAKPPLKTHTTAKKVAVKKAVAKTSPAKKTTAKTPIKAKTTHATPKKVEATKKVAHPVIPEATAVVKVKKSKIIRDSFTMPKDEYQEIHTLKIRCAKIGIPAKKSELLRAGIKVLSLLSDSALEKAMGQIPLIKTGRPQKN